MLSFFRKGVQLIRKTRAQYTPLVSVRVYEHALRNNLAAFQKAFPELAFAPVLKSNAYGHGLTQIARIFDNDALPFFVVDTYAEALILRNEGIKTPILIVGYSLPENIAQCRLRDVAFTIASIEALERVVEMNAPVVCHLKIDTGMHRQGILPEELHTALALAKKAPHIRIEGVMTHLADADGIDHSFTKNQIAQWNDAAAIAKQAFPSLRYTHCSATSGTRYADMIDENVARLGIGLYGCAHASFSVMPALLLASIVSAVRIVRKGEKVGYNATYTAPRDMRVATVPVGYAEGINRRLSNVGAMLIHNTPCPIVGRVSMNMTTIDVSDVAKTIAVSDEVIAISKNKEDPNSCENIARLCNTIPYEILAHIPSLLRRNIVHASRLP